MPSPPQVRPVRPEDHDTVVRVLARAFDADPIARYLLGREGRMARSLTLFFSAMLRHMTMLHGESWMTTGGEGAALWTPPGKWNLSLGRSLAMAPALIRAAGLLRAPRAGLLSNRVQKRHPSTPHFYLFAIGVDPDAQGRGVGSALLRDVLARCDATGTPAYLEASRPENSRLYARHGFRVTEELRMAEDAPPMWLMWREPQAPDRSAA